MNELTLKTAYWEEPCARAAFKSFIHQIHDVDFARWDSCGYWDDAYRPFSFFRGDEVISSVCAYLLDALVKSRPTKLLQISGVGTLASWRRQGLSEELTEQALSWAQGQHDGIFLFADDDAIPYYEKTGFIAFEEQLAVCDALQVTPKAGLKKLALESTSDRARLYTAAQNRCPVSQVLAVQNAKLVMFHALYRYSECCYEIPELDCFVMAQHSGRVLSIYDVIAARMPSFEDLYPYLARQDTQRVNIYFHPDQLELSAWRSEPLVGNNPFTRQAFPLADPIFPQTARA